MPVTAPVPVAVAYAMTMPPMQMAVADHPAVPVMIPVAMAMMAVTVMHLRDQAAIVCDRVADAALRSQRRRGRGGEKS